jgi:hypothetical protein
MFDHMWVKYHMWKTFLHDRVSWSEFLFVLFCAVFYTTMLLVMLYLRIDILATCGQTFARERYFTKEQAWTH